MQANNLPRSRRARARRARGAAGIGNNSPMAMLTGNTGDVKPQLLSFLCTQSAADTTTTQSQALPVLRNFASGNGSRAQVIEVLKVYFHWSAPAEVDSYYTAALSTKNFGTSAVSVSDPSVFAMSTRTVRMTTSGAIFAQQVETMDLTDGDGNGILIATDNIYLQVASATTSLANIVVVKILYRITAASVIEYVGIVQGQQ